MDNQKVFFMSFAKIYPLYIQKAEKQKRTKEEVDEVISWLTGYSKEEIKDQIEKGVDLQTFFEEAPGRKPNAASIKRVICGVRVEEIPDPRRQKIRYLDKLVDELAKGKAMEKILRG